MSSINSQYEKLINERTSQSFKENKYIAKRLKGSFNSQVDPIQQRLGKYVNKIKILYF